MGRAKHGGQGSRGWKKLHLGVNRSGVIVAQALTDATSDDALTGITLLAAVDGEVASVTADSAYDTTARLSRRGPRSRARDRTIRQVTRMGRRQRKKEAGYHRQARVEYVFFRYKSILGDGVRTRTAAGHEVDSVLACNALNRMTELGAPRSFAIGR